MAHPDDWRARVAEVARVIGRQHGCELSRVEYLYLPDALDEYRLVYTMPDGSQARLLMDAEALAVADEQGVNGLAAAIGERCELQLGMWRPSDGK